MPRIPTAEVFTPGQQKIGVRMDVGAGDAEWQGLQRVGQSSAQVGQFLQRYAMEKQEHVNRGKIAEAEILAAQTQQMLDEDIANERDQDRWLGIADQKWARYQEQVSQLQGVSPLAREAIAELSQKASARSKIGVAAAKATRDIETANANIITLATMRRRNGDIDGALGILADLNMDPLAKQRLIDQTMSEGAYQEVFQQIQTNYSDEDTLTQILDRLQAKDDNGNYTNNQGLGYDARKTLENQIIARKRQMEQARVRELATLTRRVAAGQASYEDILTANIPENDRVALTQIVDGTVKMEQEIRGEYDLIRGDIQANWFQRKLGITPQPSDKKYRTIVRGIVDAKLTKQSKIELFNMALELKATDLADFEEEGQGRMWDRTLTPAEQTLRTELIGLYRANVGKMGLQAAAGLLFSQEQAIREWFDNDKVPKTQAAIEEFARTLKAQVYAQSADQIIQSQLEGLVR